MFGVFFVINIFGCNNEEVLDSAVECLDPITEAGPDITIQYGEPAILDASARLVIDVIIWSQMMTCCC